MERPRARGLDRGSAQKEGRPTKRVRTRASATKACSPTDVLEVQGIPRSCCWPTSASGLEVSESRLQCAPENLRRRVELVLHEAWHFDRQAQLTISNLLGLKLNGMLLRSGRQTARCQKGGPMDHWLIWEELESSNSAKEPEVVGALVLRKQCASTTSNSASNTAVSGHRRGAMVVDYVAADRNRGGRGWPMLCKAEAICEREGFSVLYSAADLSQEGVSEDKGCSRMSVSVPSAVDAHKRWGFIASSAAEWQETDLKLYDERCGVVYMKKLLDPGISGYGTRSVKWCRGQEERAEHMIYR